LRELETQKRLKGGKAETILLDQVAAVSCGVTPQGVVLDMDYNEDSTTIADANFVMAGKGGWVEIQMSAEQRPVTSAEMTQRQALAEQGMAELFQLQRAALEANR